MKHWNKTLLSRKKVIVKSLTHIVSTGFTDYIIFFLYVLRLLNWILSRFFIAYMHSCFVFVINYQLFNSRTECKLVACIWGNIKKKTFKVVIWPAEAKWEIWSIRIDYFNSAIATATVKIRYTFFHESTNDFSFSTGNHSSNVILREQNEREKDIFHFCRFICSLMKLHILSCCFFIFTAAAAVIGVLPLFISIV